MGWLEDQLDAAGTQPVLLTGTGDAFCAGLNLHEVHAQQKAGTLGDFCMRIDRLATRLYAHPAPTVASINGHAIAGGCVLAMCCDHRVATDNARTRIGLNEVALGVTLPLAIGKMLVQRLPNHTRDRVLLGAELFGPQDALRLGLVDELAENPDQAAEQRLAALAKHPAPAYARTKAVLRNSAAMTEELEREFRSEDVPIWDSPEVAARLDAILTKK